MKILSRIFQFIHAQHIWLAGGKEYNALPPRLRAAINRQQDSSERLIGWIQTAILTTFAVLYVTAPQPQSGADFELVTILLGTHLLFVWFRLWLAYKISLPLWFLVLSVFVDIVLLLGSVWSFHLEYGQPPAFYLKSPTMLYVFIFIAIRALRFEPGYVLLAGLVSTGGWTALLLFALFTPPGFDAVTNSYVEYLNANRILIGGELDKMMVVLVVTVVLTVAVARARKLLLRAIIEGSAADNLSKFVPGGMAGSVASAEGSLLDAKPQTREATILFADLVAFSGLSERLGGSAKVFATMREYFKEIIAEPIKRAGGEFCFFEGDAVMVSFNLPTLHSAHATAAITAALEIQKLLKQYKFDGGIKLKARIGINTGSVTGGFIGIPDSFTTYTVYGDGVNIAARLEQLNKAKGTSILVSERSMQLSDEKQFSFSEQGSEILRGRSAAIKIFAPTKKFN